MVTNANVYKWLTRLLLALVVVLSLLTGYYHHAWTQEAKKYKRLEDLYVRLRDQLGPEAAKNLIDQSYQK